jgi:hypothetical protein
LSEDDPEIKSEAKTCVTTSAIEDVIEHLLSRYSCWFRLRKAVTWLLRFVSWLKNKPKMDPHLTARELQTAETAVIRHIQQKTYHLPMDRVTPYHPPFTFCGVDCFGPRPLAGKEIWMSLHMFNDSSYSYRKTRYYG